MAWLPWAIKQLNKSLLCGAIDSVLIAEGGHSKNMSGRSKDGSWEYLQGIEAGNKKYRLFDALLFREKYNRYDKAQAALLNTMCADIERGSWIWYLHDDEFFFDEFLMNIRQLVETAESTNANMVVTPQLSFSFNMKLYHLNRSAYLLNKWGEGTHWRPTSTLCYAGGTPYLKKPKKIYYEPRDEYITFHFNRVKTIERERDRYMLSAEKGTSATMKWFDEVWLKADLNNLDEVYKANEKILGYYGYAKDSPDMGPAIIQQLNSYNGLYPEVLKGHPYMDIDDIRKVD